MIRILTTLAFFTIVSLTTNGQLYKTIIGTPVKFDGIEVAEHDFPKGTTWQAAKDSCKAWGNGWRLPTKNELNEMYMSQNMIGGFSPTFYWSATTNGLMDGGEAWVHNFDTGVKRYGYYKYDIYLIRAVRNF